MILQLPSLLNASFDKRIDVWGYGFGIENFLNPVEDWVGNHVYLISEKSS